MQGHNPKNKILIKLKPASHNAFEQMGGGAKSCPYVNQSAPFSVQSLVPSPRGRVPERQEGVQQCINRTTTRICRTHYVRQQLLPPPKRGNGYERGCVCLA